MFIVLPPRADEAHCLWLAVARAALQAQLATISTSQTSSSAEVESLKHRIEDTEREKRDLVGIVSRLKEDASQREGTLVELTALVHH